MLVLIVFLGLLAASPTPPCEPFLRILDEADHVVVEGACINPSSEHYNGEFRFELTVDRRGESGNSRTNQSGTFTPGSESADTLVRTRVSLASGDELHARLIIYEDGRELGTKEIRRVLP